MIRLKDCREPLVDVRTACPGIVVNLGRDGRTAYLRKTVAEMICRAKTYLPKGMTFIVNDAWRPRHVQDGIRAGFIESFTRMHPAWSKTRVLQEVGKYVAPSDGVFVSGHMTGGAVDLRLWKDGRK
ncbi:MAG: hypothetical protein V1745_01775, partial [Patescibacteria group bacterium]